MAESFQYRLIQAMELRNIKAAELAKRTGLSKAQISQYVNGIYQAKQLALYKIAVALEVSEAWLMGYDVPMDRTALCTTTSDDLNLTDKEKQVVTAYRSQPDMQSAVDRLLGIAHTESVD